MNSRPPTTAQTTARQHQIIQHALGICVPDGRPCYRNQFYAKKGSDDFADCEALVAAGIMERHTPSWTSDFLYTVKNTRDYIHNMASIASFEYLDFVSSRCKPADHVLAELTPDMAHLLHMAIGVAGEAGELADAIKKAAIYGKVLDDRNVVEECGDLLFYIQGILMRYDLTLADAMQSNLEKLSLRYATGYSNAEAISRNDKQPTTT